MLNKVIFEILQIILGIFVVILILLQAKGVGLSASFSSFYRSRRGFEKIVFISTIVSIVLFVANSVIVLILS
jgi:preprotein translocase subunit SecG